MADSPAVSLGKREPHGAAPARDRPHPCADCGKRFQSRSHLQEHRRVHTGERPFPCAHCGRGFTTRHNLKRHQEIHAKERASCCARCGMLFCQRHSPGRRRAGRPVTKRRAQQAGRPVTKRRTQQAGRPVTKRRAQQVQVKEVHYGAEEERLPGVNRVLGKKVAYEIEVVL